MIQDATSLIKIYFCYQNNWHSCFLYCVHVQYVAWILILNLSWVGFANVRKFQLPDRTLRWNELLHFSTQKCVHANNDSLSATKQLKEPLHRKKKPPTLAFVPDVRQSRQFNCKWATAGLTWCISIVTASHEDINKNVYKCDFLIHKGLESRKYIVLVDRLLKSH